MKPQLVAHRGVHNEVAGVRENTLTAIEAAAAAGAWMVEVDVQVSQDGAVVLLHDSTLERLWGDRRAVGDVSLAEIRELGGGDRRIPLLREALQAVAVAGVGLLIDLDGAQSAEPAAAVVGQYLTDVNGTPGHIAWCGHPEAMAVVRDVLPEAEIWMPWYTTEAPRALDLAALQPAVVNLNHLLVSPELVRAVHALGPRVAAWTVDDDAQVAHLASLGVDSITTNAVTAAQRVLSGSDGDAFTHAFEPWTRELAIAHALAEHAADVTGTARHEGAGAVSTKSGPADHVTEIDRSIERRVRDVLAAQFPEHAVVGEEYGGVDSETCWYVDPIDGTANLANGVPWTSFSLALVDHGRPVVAAVLDPVGPAPIIAAQGHGVWREGAPVRVPPMAHGASHDPLAGFIVTTELAGAVAWPGMHELLDRLAKRHCTVRIPGSGTATLAGVALGRGVAAIIHDYSPIDHAAAVLVVLEAGGVVLDASGRANPHPLGGAVIAGRDEVTARALWQEWCQARASTG